MKFLTLFAFATFSIISLSAYAGTPVVLTPYDEVTTTSGSSEKTDNQVYAGLVWTWGEKTPAALLGFSHGQVESDGDTHGIHASLSINFMNGIQLGKAKLTYLNGKEDFQGEAGVGYDLMKNVFIIPVGVNAPYVAAGVDLSRQAMEPYFMLHTRDEFDEPDQITATECQFVGAGNGEFANPDCTN